ncbi:hypothetical protein ACFFX0_04715 [Citricoccus parietis]|uniref:Uncharacterized protein n=1 Tax=Citricoccus parietis TaxID=592307 RepID=A0ABV5FV61_9MICC
MSSFSMPAAGGCASPVAGAPILGELSDSASGCVSSDAASPSEPGIRWSPPTCSESWST